MRKDIYLTRLAIMSVAALFVGYTGTVQAIPLTLRSHSLNQALQSSRPINRNQTSVVSLASSLSALTLARTAGGQRNAGLGNTHRRGGATTLPSPVIDQGAYPASGLHAPLLPPAPVRLPKPPIAIVSGGGVPIKNVQGVPDGGRTATLLAGSICGLALLRRKLKA